MMRPTTTSVEGDGFFTFLVTSHLGKGDEGGLGMTAAAASGAAGEVTPDAAVVAPVGKGSRSDEVPGAGV